MIFNGGFYSGLLMKGANYCDDGYIAAIHNFANFHIAFRSLNFHDILITPPTSRLKKTGDLIFPFDFLNSRMRRS